MRTEPNDAILNIYHLKEIGVKSFSSFELHETDWFNARLINGYLVWNRPLARQQHWEIHKKTIHFLNNDLARWTFTPPKDSPQHKLLKEFHHKICWKENPKVLKLNPIQMHYLLLLSWKYNQMPIENHSWVCFLWQVLISERCRFII